jgi:hypothetical protein
VPRDPSNGQPVPFARDPADFAARWYNAENDFLGDPFSSHVNPVFWHFHGWIDDRIEDWFRAHERFHPGEVTRLQVNGVPWFAPGRWVEVDDPWLGRHPWLQYHAGIAGGQVGGDGSGNHEAGAAHHLHHRRGKTRRPVPRVPQRPWYARNLKVKPARLGAASSIIREQARSHRFRCQPSGNIVNQCGSWLASDSIGQQR